MNLNIGYNFNEVRLSQLNDLINAIDYIQHNSLNNNDIIKILQHYEELYPR